MTNGFIKQTGIHLLVNWQGKQLLKKECTDYEKIRG